MDQQLRRLERETMQGSPDAVVGLVNTLIRIGDPQTVFTTLQKIITVFPPEALMSLLSSDQAFALIQGVVTHLQGSCDHDWLPAIEEFLRDVTLAFARQFGVWHGFMVLSAEGVRIYTNVLRNGFYYPYEEGDNEEDWRDSQEGDIIYVYYNPSRADKGQLAPNRSIWVGLPCNIVPEARFVITWMDNGDYLPDFDGIGVEEARISGTPGQILGSYKLLDAEEIDSDESDIGGKPFLFSFPEMRLHIIPCT